MVRLPVLEPLNLVFALEGGLIELEPEAVSLRLEQVSQPECAPSHRVSSRGNLVRKYQ
jgi:hypothetical protein